MNVETILRNYLRINSLKLMPIHSKRIAKRTTTTYYLRVVIFFYSPPRGAFFCCENQSSNFFIVSFVVGACACVALLVQ